MKLGLRGYSFAGAILKSLFIFFSSFIAVVSYARPNQTFYVQILGDREVGARLLEKLVEKECHSLGDTCHTFKKFENDGQIKGDFSRAGSSLLYRVNIKRRDGIGRYNLQIFQRDGKSFRRVLNAGNFTPQKFVGYENRRITDDEFLGHLIKHSIGLTFK